MRKGVYFRTFETFVVSTLHWGTRNEQNHLPSLSCLLLPRAPDPLPLPVPISFAPLPKKPPSHSPSSSQSPSHCGTAAPCQPRSRGTDFLLLLTPESSSQKGPPPPGATPPRSSPSARKMANNQGNPPSACDLAPFPGQAAVQAAGKISTRGSTEWMPAFAAACEILNKRVY